LITPVPNETISQFKNDLFDKLIEFANVDIVIGCDIPSYLKMRKENPKYDRPYVVMMSKQMDHVSERIHGAGIADGVKFDVIYYDENHHGGTTDLSKAMVFAYKGEQTQIVLLTATYHKPHHIWNVPEENIVRWDLDGLEAHRAVWKACEKCIAWNNKSEKDAARCIQCGASHVHIERLSS
jgi:hypothetical protein